MTGSRTPWLSFLIEFSIPLLVGVAVALVAANVAYDAYHAVLHEPWGALEIFGHRVTLHFFVNDIFMVFFFGIAAKEITESVLPGGSLNPARKAINPLIATVGGVVVPVAVFFAGLALCYATGVYGSDVPWDQTVRGWGVPTATDIALAWLCARFVFGRGHPAIEFLLLLAIVDDAIGLVIIAVFYGDPELPVNLAWLGLVVAAMGIAWALRLLEVRKWWLYVGLAGPLAWSGMMLAHLHPALALCFVVPFLPGPRRDTGLFRAEDEIDRMGPELAADLHMEHSPLDAFEHRLKVPVDFGLFLFAFSNAGVPLSEIGPMTWLVLAGLMIGKTVGVTLFSRIAVRLGFPLPLGMTPRDVAMAGLIAAVGLTVALFVASAAFTDPSLQGQAKMGALLSGFVGVASLAIGRIWGFGRKDDS